MVVEIFLGTPYLTSSLKIYLWEFVFPFYAEIRFLCFVRAKVSCGGLSLIRHCHNINPQVLVDRTLWCL